MTTNTTKVQQPLPAASAAILPTQEKATDKPIHPVTPAATATPSMTSTPAPTAAVAPNAQTVKPGAAATPTYTPTATKPSSEALVENRIGGLLDPNNPLMRKAKAQAQGYSASRGLQSSSIGGEIALSSMIDKAQSIASQDANTYAQFEKDDADRVHSLGMQNNQNTWQSGENVLDRDFKKEFEDLQQKNRLGLLDAEGQQRMKEMEVNFGYQQQMQELQHKQQLGILDVQGQQQLQQMEKNAQLTSQRDQILQQYQKELNTQQNQQQLAVLDKDLAARNSMLKTELDARSYSEYNNAVSSGYNNMLAQIGAVYSNPNMTAQQQEAGVAKITQMFKSQQTQLETLYGLKTPTSSAPPATGVTQPTNSIPQTGQKTGQASGSVTTPRDLTPVNVGAPVTPRYLER